MNRSQTVIATVVIVGFLFLTAMLILLRVGMIDMPEWMKDALILIIGAWVAKFGTVVDYVFGSSQNQRAGNVDG